jgi:hypothetical protein
MASLPSSTAKGAARGLEIQVTHAEGLARIRHAPSGSVNP